MLNIAEYVWAFLWYLESTVLGKNLSGGREVISKKVIFFNNQRECQKQKLAREQFVKTFGLVIC